MLFVGLLFVKGKKIRVQKIGLTSDGGPVMTAKSGVMRSDVDLTKYRRHPVVASSLTFGAVERSVRDDRRYAQPDSQSAQVGSEVRYPSPVVPGGITLCQARLSGDGGSLGQTGFKCRDEFLPL
jgi:hypothetical protein